MILLDTNIIIYLASGRLKAETLADEDIAHASVTEIETLGYTKLQVQEAHYLREWFSLSRCFPLDGAVTQRAIDLRQMKSMSLGDAVIAATALEHDLPLWTANEEDFKWIEGLEVINPIAGDGR